MEPCFIQMGLVGVGPKLLPKIAPMIALPTPLPPLHTPRSQLHLANSVSTALAPTPDCLQFKTLDSRATPVLDSLWSWVSRSGVAEVMHVTQYI